MGHLIRFPQELRTADVEHYRPEPAMILIMPVKPSQYRLFDEPLLCYEAFKQVTESFAALREALEEV